MPSEAYLANLVSKSAGYTVLQGSDQDLVATAAMTFTLPAASTCFPGQQFRFINDIANGGLITVAPNGADLINAVNASLATLSPRFSELVAVTDGVSKWWISLASTGPETRHVVFNSGAGTTTAPFYTAPNDGTTWQVAAVSARFSTASTSGTLQITADAAAAAPGAGTVQLTGTISLAGTANTTVNGTVIATPTTIAAGQSLAALFAGTMTNIVGLVIDVTLKRLT